MNNDETRQLLLNDSRGIYIPRDFTDCFHIEKWNITKEQAKDLRDPAGELYWETWDEVLNNAEFNDGEHKWTLHQDGDLFAIREDHEWEDE